MAIRELIWACVTCGREGALARVRRGEECSACGTQYTRARGSKILVRERGSEGRVYTTRALIDLLPPAGTTGTERCEVREAIADVPLHVFGRYLGRYERLGEAREGVVTLDEDRLRFAADDGHSTFDVPILDVTAIQPSSHALQIKARARPVFSIRFPSSSPKLWEERLQAALTAAYRAAGRGEIQEFQPRVCTRRDTSAVTGSARVRSLVETARYRRPPRPWQYRLASWIARNAWKHFGGGVEVQGLEHVPAKGPFIVIANHQSYLETMLVPAVMSRATHTMAKSTQFGVPVYGWLMARLFAFPVRRYEVDPQAVRYLVRRLAEGYGVVIFPEGERTWDGELQPARLGVVRLALHAGVPVVPCRVEGAFDAWPRWSSRPQRWPIRLTFAPALHLPRAEGRAAREAYLHASLDLIRSALGG